MGDIMSLLKYRYSIKSILPASDPLTRILKSPAFLRYLWSLDLYETLFLQKSATLKLIYAVLVRRDLAGFTICAVTFLTKSAYWTLTHHNFHYPCAHLSLHRALQYARFLPSHHNQ